MPETKNKTKEEADRRTYYEVFGDTVVMLRTFKLLVLFLAAIIFFQVYVNLVAHRKPPLVIAVDAAGHAEASEAKRLPGEPDPIQIESFVREFLEVFTAYDSKSVEYDFSKALNYMHSDFQKRATHEMLDSAQGGLPLLKQLKEQNLFSRIQVQEIRIEKNVPGWVHLGVSGVRRIYSYLDSAQKRETLFNAYVTLAKVPRTRREPYGLLVYDYREHLVKDLAPETGGGDTNERKPI